MIGGYAFRWFPLAVLVVLAAGCRYTTQGYEYQEKAIYIAPVRNVINIADESSKYERRRSYPLLLEKKLTNQLHAEFDINSVLLRSDSPSGALQLRCSIVDYRKETLRYEKNDDIREQRLWLTVQFQLISADTAVLIDRTVVGDTSYFLAGTGSRTERSAQNDLVKDVVRRIVDAVIERW